MHKQFFVRTDVGNLHHPGDVVLVVHERLNGIRRHAQLLGVRLGVAQRGCPEEANQKLLRKRCPPQPVASTQQCGLGRLALDRMAVLGHAREVEHLRAELGVRVTACTEDVQQFHVISQPRQHTRLDLGEVTHRQLIAIGGHDRLAQERSALEVLHVDGAALAGRPPPGRCTIVGKRYGQRPTLGDF